MKKLNIEFVVGMMFLALGSIIHYSSDYMREKPITVTVLDKFMVPGGHKSSGHLEMVMKTDDGITFDRNVSATTYSTCQKGQRYIMTLRPFDVKQIFWKNAVYFFGTVICWSIGIALLVLEGLLVLLCWLSDSIGNNSTESPSKANG